MTPPDILAAAAEIGVQIGVRDGRLCVHPPGSLTQELREVLLRNRKALVDHLVHHEITEAWNFAVEAVACAWNRHAGERRSSGRKPDWLSHEVEEAMERRAEEARLKGDLPGTLAAIDAWRSAWLCLLSTEASPPTYPGGAWRPTTGVPPSPGETSILARNSGPAESTRLVPDQPVGVPPDPGVQANLNRYRDGICPYGHRRRWRSVHGVVVCAECHPPASPDLVSGWLERNGGTK